MKQNIIEIEINDKKYSLVFDINTMEDIQEKFGSLALWQKAMAESTADKPALDELRFFFYAAINEGIDIKNEGNGTDEPHITERQAGRLMTDYGLAQSAQAYKQSIIEAGKGNSEKN